MLPDEVLLAVFYCCAEEDPYEESEMEWLPLVHVCRRWRSIVFGSPRRLKLHLVCTDQTSARDTLDVWPALPLSIQLLYNFPTESVDNIIALLERRDRVCQISLRGVPSWYLEKVLEAMQEPFPELTELDLSSTPRLASRSSRSSGGKTIIPDSFLGGYAPHLQIFHLNGISFPALPKLLLSTTHLVYLRLHSIPQSGYISPEAMATTLSKLTSLASLVLEFKPPPSDRAIRRLPPLTRTVLPALISFGFKGASEYLDDFVSHIDAPLLESFDINFFKQIAFDTPQVIQFVSRSPMLKSPERARISFEDHGARVVLSSHTSGYQELFVQVLCREFDWQVSSMVRVCTSSLPPLSTLENLRIYGGPDWQDNIENTVWLDLFRPFAGVKNLYISQRSMPYIVPVLEELVGGRTTEVLPTLQNIFLEGLHWESSEPFEEGIRQFVAAREVTGHPVAVTLWERNDD